MLKKSIFWLFSLFTFVLQSCSVDSVTTYHTDKTTSILMDVDMKEFFASSKSFGDSSSSDNKLKELNLFPKEWRNLYEVMKEDTEKKGKKLTKNDDSLKLLKKMFVKSNFDKDEMTGISFRMDRLSLDELKSFTKNSRKSNFISATNSDKTLWDGKTLTLDTEYFNPQSFSEALKKERETEAESDSAKIQAESAIMMMKMFKLKFHNKIKFENKIKSVEGKHDWVKQLDDYTLDMSFSFDDLFNDSVKLKNIDSKIIVTTE